MFNLKTVNYHGVTMEFPAGWCFPAVNLYERLVCLNYSSIITAIGKDNTTNYGRECFYEQARKDADDDMRRWMWSIHLARGVRKKYMVRPIICGITASR